MIDWVGSLSKLILVDPASSTIMDIGPGEVWYKTSEEGLVRFHREGDGPPYRLSTGFEYLSLDQLHEMFWRAAHEAARENQGGKRQYASPYTAVDTLAKLMSEPFHALAMSGETYRRYFYPKDTLKWGAQQRRKWKKVQDDLDAHYIYRLDDNGPLGEVFGFTLPEDVGRIFCNPSSGQIGFAIRMGTVAKVVVTEDGKPIDFNKLFGDDK